MAARSKSTPATTFGGGRDYYSSESWSEWILQEQQDRKTWYRGRLKRSGSWEYEFQDVLDSPVLSANSPVGNKSQISSRAEIAQTPRILRDGCDYTTPQGPDLALDDDSTSESPHTSNDYSIAPTSTSAFESSATPTIPVFQQSTTSSVGMYQPAGHRHHMSNWPQAGSGNWAGQGHSSSWNLNSQSSDTISLEGISLQPGGSQTTDRTSSSGATQYYGGSPSAKSLYKGYKVISQPSRFFKVGRVFKVLWTEPFGNDSDDETGSVIPSRYGEKAYTKIRRFVVVRAQKRYSLCIMLNTYNGKGTSKDQIDKDNYAAVYPVGGDPKACDDYGLSKRPFPIHVEDPKEQISPMSRLNFGRIYTVEHNIKVLKFGRIPDSELERLREYYIQSIG